MIAFIKDLYRFFASRCPKCGGKMIDHRDWNMSQCEDCGEKSKYS